MKDELGSSKLSTELQSSSAAGTVDLSFKQVKDRAKEFRNQHKQAVVIQGLGFVGVAVATAVAQAIKDDGTPLYLVIGKDRESAGNRHRLASLSRGELPFLSPDPNLEEQFQRSVQGRGNLIFFHSEEVFQEADIIVCALPLDISASGSGEFEVSLKEFESGIREVGRNMREKALLVIESTVPVGACRKLILPWLKEERQKRGIESEPLLSHAYERVMPGPNYLDSVKSFWRSISADSHEALEVLSQFLSSYTDTEHCPLWKFSDFESTELAKILENSYRAVNIAFLLEWTRFADRLGINMFEVVESIRVRKGTHDNLRYPGFGVGGYCLTKDSFFAQWSMKELYDFEDSLQLTLQALQINAEMTDYSLQVLKEVFGRPMNESRILIAGVSYLPSVGDARNSPSLRFARSLQEEDATVIASDPYLSEWAEAPQFEFLTSMHQVDKPLDAVVFAVAHPEYRLLEPQKLKEFCNPGAVVLDANDALTDEQARVAHGLGLKVCGVGKGHWRKLGYHLL